MERLQPVPVFELIPGMNRKGLIRHLGEVEWDVARRVNNSAGDNFDTPAINWLNDFSYLNEVGAFQNDVLINLGSGSACIARTLKAAKAGGAAGYVAVDIGNETVKNVAERAKEYMRDYDLPIAVVREDMLSFLKRLPDHSVSVICSGVDDCIVKPDYALQVSKELERTLNKAYLRSSQTIVLPKPNGWAEEKLKPDQPYYFMRRINNGS